jgi:hypothetical protein
LDITVTTMPEGNSWGLTDLLGRDMGRVTETRPGVFKIKPAGNALETIGDAITSRPYPSLDSALAAIEEHTRGVCRRAP